MKTLLIFAGLVVLTLELSFSKAQAAIDYSATVLQDPNTKILFYLESDRRHIAAISPNGKLLWCSEVVHVAPKGWQGIKPERIQAFWFASQDGVSSGKGQASDVIKVSITGEGFGGMTGYIDKKTGKFHPGEVS
jgi:hypothetical protein